MFNLLQRSAWLPVLLWAALIFTLSAMPHIPSPTKLFPHADKVGHVLLYLPFGFLLRRALDGRACAGLIAFILGALYGLSDEYHQMYVPGRMMDAADLLADCIGIGLGIWLFRERVLNLLHRLRVSL